MPVPASWPEAVFGMSLIHASRPAGGSAPGQGLPFEPSLSGSDLGWPGFALPKTDCGGALGPTHKPFRCGTHKPLIRFSSCMGRTASLVTVTTRGASEQGKRLDAHRHFGPLPSVSSDCLLSDLAAPFRLTLVALQHFRATGWPQNIPLLTLNVMPTIHAGHPS
jgi:hypothetical protein